MTAIHTHKTSAFHKYIPHTAAHTMDNNMNVEFEHNHRGNRLDDINEDDQLSALPQDLNASFGSSPTHSPSMSPHPVRHRCHTIDITTFQRNYRRTRSAPSQLPKDPIQPKAGSITDIHLQETESLNDAEEEEEDVFLSELPPMRSRSQTCPEVIIRKRRDKIRSLRRPNTPPPLDLCAAIRKISLPGDNDINKQIDMLVKLDNR